jgi:hypothetical protein
VRRAVFFFVIFFFYNCALRVEYATELLKEHGAVRDLLLGVRALFVDRLGAGCLDELLPLPHQHAAFGPVICARTKSVGRLLCFSESLKTCEQVHACDHVDNERRRAACAFLSECEQSRKNESLL